MFPTDFSTFLNSISSQPLRVLDASISKYTVLDLSKNNKNLNTVDVSSSTKLGTFINSHIKNNHVEVAFGGYNETRTIYNRSGYFNTADSENQRNIHIGVDLWCAAETPIFTPLDATVHSFKNNTNFGDYGPTIILKHVIDTVEFYTLYGHLSEASIENLKVNHVFKQGEQIATLGDATINGDYPPHLHFQIIKDIQNHLGDYPGVCNKQDLEFYLGNCPDPNVLLKL